MEFHSFCFPKSWDTKDFLQLKDTWNTSRTAQKIQIPSASFKAYTNNMSVIEGGTDLATEVYLDSLKRDLPVDFLDQMGPTGITRDYVNTYTGALALSEPLISSTAKPSEKVQEKFVSAISNILTYSEYWGVRIAKYNEKAESEGREKVDGKKASKLLVTNQPMSRKLDEIAIHARNLVPLDMKIDPILIARAFIPLAADAVAIIDPVNGAGKKRRILENNGLAPVPNARA